MCSQFMIVSHARFHILEYLDWQWQPLTETRAAYKWPQYSEAIRSDMDRARAGIDRRSNRSQPTSR